MSLIKILAGTTEIDFVKDSLTIKKENNALIEDFKVSHSSYPFLVIENKNTVLALGPRDITSVSKSKIIPVTVIELGQKYYGELQVTSFLSGFRKCNLKYATELINILSEPINSYMPTVSVIPGVTDPEPYVEEATEPFIGDENWADYPIPFLSNIYPQVKFQFPTLQWDEFTTDLTTEDWLLFNGKVNRYSYNEDTGLTKMGVNIYGVDDSVLGVVNINLAMPQVFLLSPLFYALESIGFTLTGNFSTNAFIRRILLLSMKTNNTVITLRPDIVDLTLNSTWYFGISFNLGPGLGGGYYQKTNTYTITSAGEYTLAYRLVFNSFEDLTGISKMFLFVDNTPSIVFESESFSVQDGQYVYEGEHTFSILDNEVGDDIYARFYNLSQNAPLESSIQIQRTDNEKDFYQMHPTIDLSRYVENWTTAEYLNQLKKLFNLDVSFNDEKKQLILNFNETFSETEIPEIISKSLQITSYDIAAHTSFLLQYSNTEDAALFITRDSTTSENYVTDAYTYEISSRFKLVPSNGYTSELSEELSDKDGVGLMLYDPSFAPYTVFRYNNQNLTINEEGGIYDSFHKKWLKFRLNASNVELSGTFTEIEVAKFNAAKSIYIDKQHYRIVSLSLNESSSTIIKVSFSLESVNY